MAQQPAGIIEGQAMRYDSTPARGGVQQEAQPPGKGKPPVEGSEEQLLERFLDASGNLVKKVREPLMKSASGGSDGLAQAAAIVFERIDREFPGLPDVVRFLGGMGAFSQVLQMVEASGKDLSEEEKIQALSKALAAQVKKGIESGRYDPHDILAATDEAQKKIAAQQQGPQGQPEMTGGRNGL